MFSQRWTRIYTTKYLHKIKRFYLLASIFVTLASFKNQRIQNQTENGNAKLLDATKGVQNASELFKAQHFYELEDAIKSLCICKNQSTSDTAILPGLKIAYDTLIRLSSKIVLGDYIIRNENEKANSIERFQKVFNLNYSEYSEYRLKETRSRQNRKPSALPQEDNLDRLRTHLVTQITQITTALQNDVTKKLYIELRRMVITRVTILKPVEEVNQPECYCEISKKDAAG